VNAYLRDKYRFLWFVVFLTLNNPFLKGHEMLKPDSDYPASFDDTDENTQQKQKVKKKQSSYRYVPKGPPDYDELDHGIWRATCARMLSELDQIFASDLELVHRYVQINRSLRKVNDDVARLDAQIDLVDDPKDMAAVIKVIGELRKQDMFYSNLMRQTFRAIETTVNERHRRLKEKQKQQGGQVGVRQKPARSGVPSNQKAGGKISWVDKAKGGE
jgi:hypothetical protein